VLAAALIAFGFAGTGPAAREQDMEQPVTLTYVFVVVAGASIALWRWRPWWTFGVAGSALVAYLALGYPYGPMLIIGIFAIYGLTSSVALRPALIATAILVVGVVAATWIRIETVPNAEASDFWSGPAWVLIPAAIGVAVRIRRESTREVRQAQARTAASEERLRMAQEIHDTVGHGLAVIAMQAGVAMHVLDKEPEKARESLQAIRIASRHALDDLRAELDALRGSTEQSALYRPAVGLDDVAGLVGRITSTGLPVALNIDAGIERLPVDVDVTAYRIIQESLTNVLKHAGADASARVSVTCEDDELVIEIQNDGTGVPAAGSDAFTEGHGIGGMKQRAGLVDGALRAGPSESGGFVVIARIPVSGSHA
jgi:signal transduction histidine kinase